MPAFPTRSVGMDATPPDPGRGRSILLLVTGGIAAYKACFLVRLLTEAGCAVRVAMTRAATRFVTPLTFEALSGQPVGESLWGEGGERPLDHIQWARAADLMLVAPATANFLAKMAHGLANDLPSTLVSAASSPVIVAPAMNDHMWASAANQENLQTLRQRGVQVIEPGTGWLACGTVAEGRLAEPEAIVAEVLARLVPGPLAGTKVLVTAGPTYEPIDAVRFIGNRSSGRMGIALADVARELGADVTLLLGPTEVPPPAGVRVERFATASELAALVRQHAPQADAIAMAAAVADFRPAQARAGKMKKDAGPPAIELTPTEDVLASLGRAKPAGQFLIGFVLETGDDTAVEEQTRRKLARKNLDLACGNHAGRPGEGFGSDTNRMYLWGRDERGSWVGPAGKREVASAIWRRALHVAAAPEVTGAADPTDAGHEDRGSDGARHAVPPRAGRSRETAS
jgi:phosphopantothenoylcysteine decarboxylase/phosphopantothenate--cysteine ligase